VKGRCGVHVSSGPFRLRLVQEAKRHTLQSLVDGSDTPTGKSTSEGSAEHSDSDCALTKDAAESLVAQYRRDGVRNWDFSHLTSLTPEVASVLARCEGVLRLDGLSKLSFESADSLARCGGDLSLNGLINLTPEIAIALANLRGSLHLGGVTKLSPEVATALVGHGGGLYLGALNKVSPKISDVLAGYKGFLQLGGHFRLSRAAAAASADRSDQDFWQTDEFEGMDDQTIQDAKSPSEQEPHEPIAWPTGAESRVDAKSTNSLAEEIVEAVVLNCGRDGTRNWDFSHLRSMTPEVARGLSKLCGDLYLDGITTISLEVAQGLATHKGLLHLDGLTTLEPAVAEALATHRGGLSLMGVVSLSPQVAGALANYKCLLLLSERLRLSATAAETLGKREDRLLARWTESSSEEAIATGPSLEDLSGIKTWDEVETDTETKVMRIDD
jgi:hypothetical protein